MDPATEKASQSAKGIFDIFLTYLRLGCYSFGGPVAHLAYYKELLVTRRAWLSEARYAELLGLCQFIPGPSSSQLGFAIGWHRGGLLGACVAWTGFTLPSALLMMTAAYGLIQIGDAAKPVIGGLLLAAVAVVANAVFSLAKHLCPDGPRIAIALLSAATVLYLPGNTAQVAVILAGGLAAQLIYRQRPAESPPNEPQNHRLRRRILVALLALYTILLATSFLLPASSPLSFYGMIYRAGALVFGGGHVVLPLLQDSVVAGGWVNQSDFLAGYSAAQALPGPLFTFAAFLGVTASPLTPEWLSGLIALVSIFLPGMLLLVALLPLWSKLRSTAWAQAGLMGANAAVVGLLVAAFINPVWVHGIHDWMDVAIAALAFFCLFKLRAPAWSVVFACGLIGFLMG
ncbi:MAG: chromate efflux transporter [Opitutales bacterium]